MHKTRLGIFLMVILIPIVGELKFYPFTGELSSFRVSFGSPAFLFFLLWLRSTSFLYSGLLVSLSVLIFRIMLDLFGGADFFVSFSQRYPAFFYYITYATVFHITKAKKLYSRPLSMALTAVGAEFIASLAELLFTLHSFSAIFTVPILSKILLIAVIRNFFILSFIFIIYLRDAELAFEQQKGQNQHLLLLISDLYQEAIQLSKSLINAENITRDCYLLYETLHNNKTIDKHYAEQTILTIAGQIHEIKKDNQRIYASLTQLISERKIRDYLPVQELASIIVNSHQKYADSLKKHITFEVACPKTDLPPLHVYTVLSVINNLVANAVEAISSVGKIKLSIQPATEYITFEIADNGPGIPEKKHELIFEPGYTNKFDKWGKPSTGMGLPYIKDLVHSLTGKITLTTPHSDMKTVFTIELPLDQITQKGD